MTESMKTPTTTKQPARPEAVKVRQLWFVEAMDIPGSRMGMPKNLKAEDPTENKSRWEIEFQPWLRAFRVSHYEAGQLSPTYVRMVPEARINAWEPW